MLRSLIAMSAIIAASAAPCFAADPIAPIIRKLGLPDAGVIAETKPKTKSAVGFVKGFHSHRGGLLVSIGLGATSYDLVRFCDPATGADGEAGPGDLHYDLLMKSFEHQWSVSVGGVGNGKDADTGYEKICIASVSVGA